MKSPFAYVVPGFAAVVIGSVVALAPVANAATPPAPTTNSVIVASGEGVDPLVPFGTDPQEPGRLGYVNSNHDEVNTSNGQVDLPF